MGFAMFILREIPDNCPLVLENALRTLGQFLDHWRGLTGGAEDVEELAKEKDSLRHALAWVEACALVTFCSYRSVTRKFSLGIMNKVRSLLDCLGMTRVSCAECVLVCGCVSYPGSWGLDRIQLIHVLYPLY